MTIQVCIIYINKLYKLNFLFTIMEILFIYQKKEYFH